MNEPIKVRVRLLKPFSDAVGRPEVELTLLRGATVRELVVSLCERYPALAPHVRESGGTLTEYLTMFLNDRPVLDFDMALADGDEVLMMFPVSGG